MALAFIERYRLYRKGCREEFFACVGGLLEHEQVRRLDACVQHYKFTRLRHSMDVAYLSFWIAKLLRFDSESTARAALLHDLFFHSEGQHSGSLLFSHPRIALENAREICSLNRIEEDIILKHMFLLTPGLPRYRESYVVTMIDKYCAAREYLVSLFTRKKAYSAEY